MELPLELLSLAIRGVVLIVSTLCGVMCIFLGWRMMFEKLKGKSELNIDSKNFKMSIITNFPGLLFLFFGAAIVVSLITQTRWQYSECEDGSPASIAFSSGNLGFPLLSSAHAATPPKKNTQQPAPHPSCNCLYRPRKVILLFRGIDEATERQQIVAAIDAALIAMKKDVLENPSDDDLQRQYSKLREVRDGFLTKE